MKRILLAVAFIGVFGVATAAAQTRVSVSLGFGVPAPYVVYTPRAYHYSYYEPYRLYEPYPVVVVGPRVYRRAPLVVVRRHPVVIVRRHGRHHHRHW